MTSSSPNLSKPTCRVCLQNISDDGMSSIFDLDTDLDELFIYEKIEQCAGIEVVRDESFPTFICNNCYGLLKVAYEFRITCRKTEEFLKNTLVAEKINNPIKQTVEKNPLSIKDNTKIKKKSRPKTKKCFKTVASPVEQFIKNELIVSPDANDKHTPNNENTKDSSPIPELIKNELIIPPDSPTTNFEEPITDTFDEEDRNVLYFDDNCYNENNILSDENTKIFIEEINFDVVKDQISGTKIKKRKKNANEKGKKSTKARSKVLTLVKNDNGEKLIKKPAYIKKEKKEKRPHICEICGNKFPHRYTLKNHIKRHLNEKPFKCEICGYSSHSNMELVRHLRKHTGSKPFKCQYCSRAFGDHSTLIKHERVHRNERPFKCEICGSSFSYPAVLKRHKLVHTGEKPYKCEICGKCFNDRYHLQSHLKTIQHKNDPRVETLLQNIRENNI